MAFYYVRDNGVFKGTATADAGRETVQRTGAWDVDVTKTYPSLLSIFFNQATTGNTVVDEDVIVVADDHIETYAVDVLLKMKTLTAGKVLIVQSFDVLNQEVYKRGAQVLATAGADITLFSRTSNRNNAILKGMIFNAAGHISMYARESKIVFDNSDVISQDNWGASNTYTIDIDFINDCRFEIHDIRTTTLNITFYGGVVKFRNTGYGMRDTNAPLNFIGCDLSESLCGSLCSYNSSAYLYGCKVTPAILDGSWFAPYNNGKSIVMKACDVGNGYYMEVQGGVSGAVSTNTITYLNYSYDGTGKASIKMEASSSVNRAATQKFKLCEIPAQDLSATDTTYRVNLLLDTGTAASLTDSDFWVELSPNDNTSLALGKIVSSRSSDILATGTTLTASAETWLGTLPTTSQAYQVDITLSAASLTNVTNSSVVVYANLAVPNADVYVDQAVQIGT